MVLCQQAKRHSYLGGDNVIICQEIIHALKHTKASYGGMIVKIDLGKVFDRLERNFVEEMLLDASILPSMVNVIMGLMRRSSCRLLWNGELMEVIKLTRGHRQGFLLSPYIFILCLKRLVST